MCQKLSAKNAPKIFIAKAGYKMLAKWTPRGFSSILDLCEVDLPRLEFRSIRIFIQNSQSNGSQFDLWTVSGLNTCYIYFVNWKLWKNFNFDSKFTNPESFCRNYDAEFCHIFLAQLDLAYVAELMSNLGRGHPLLTSLPQVKGGQGFCDESIKA